MDKTEGSIVSPYEGGTREDFLFTYSEEERQEIRFNKMIVEQEIKGYSYFIVYEQQLVLGFSEPEAMLFNFIDGYTKAGKLFRYSISQICKKTHRGKDKVINTIKSLKDKGYIIEHPGKDKFGQKRRLLSSTTKYSLELLKLIGWSENPTEVVGKSDRGLSENPTHSNIYSNINKSSKEEIPSTEPSAEFGSKFLNSFQSRIESIYSELAMELIVDRKSLSHRIDPKTGEVRATKKEFMEKHGYKTPEDMIRDLLQRLKTMKFGQGWASNIDKLREKRADILNNTQTAMKIGEKGHFDWYLNNIVDKLKFDDMGEEKYYRPASYSTYLQRECGVERSVAQDLRDKFLSE